MAKSLEALADSGVSIRLDDLGWTCIASGRLGRMVEAGEIVGITTNPTIFAKAIGSGTGYEDQLRDLALRGMAVGETLRMLMAWDVRAACDINDVGQKFGMRAEAVAQAGREVVRATQI